MPKNLWNTPNIDSWDEKGVFGLLETWSRYFHVHVKWRKNGIQVNLALHNQWLFKCLMWLATPKHQYFPYINFTRCSISENIQDNI